MTYTIRSATWGNTDKNSAVILSDECSYVAISEADTPEEWKNFTEWQKTNPVSDLPVGKPMTKKDILEKKMGMTITELKALING